MTQQENFYDEQYYWTRYPEILSAADYNTETSDVDSLHVKVGERVLDLGSGLGFKTCKISMRGATVVGIDRSRFAIATSHKKFGAKPNIFFIVACADHLPLKVGSFDGALASDLLEHLHPQQSQSALRQIMIVLKPQGRFVCYSPINEFGPAGRIRNLVLRSLGSKTRDSTHVRNLMLKDLANEITRVGFVISAVYVSSSSTLIRAVTKIPIIGMYLGSNALMVCRSP